MITRRFIPAIALILLALGCQTTLPIRHTVGSTKASPGSGKFLSDGSDSTGSVTPNGVGVGLATSVGGSIISNNGGGAVAANTIFGQLRAPATIISDQGGAIISNNGGGIVSDQGGSIISNNGGSLSNKPAFYRLAEANAVEQVPVGGVTVELRDAVGETVRDAQGKPYTAVTDDTGNFAFKSGLPALNLIVRAVLPGDRGVIQAVATKDSREAPVEADLYSTLTTAYIMTKYVASQGDRQLTLDRLPGSVNAETRAIAQDAFARTGATVPGRLAETTVFQVAEVLRQTNHSFDAQMEKVRKLLILAGLSNRGEGQLATTVSVELPDGLAEGPDGSLYFEDGRIWRVRPNGVLETVLGGGTLDFEQASGSPLARSLDFDNIDTSFWFDSSGRLIGQAGSTIIRVESDGRVTKLGQFPDEGKTYTRLLTVRGDEIYLIADSYSKSPFTHKLLRMRPGEAAVDVAEQLFPVELVRDGNFGFDPVHGVLMRFADLSKQNVPDQFGWLNLDTGAFTPWLFDRSGDMPVNAKPHFDRNGNIFYTAADGNLHVWRPGATTPLVFSNWQDAMWDPEGSSLVRYGDVLLARDGSSVWKAGFNQVWRLTAKGKTLVAGLDPKGQLGGVASNLALFEPVSLTLASDGFTWFVDWERGKLLRMDAAGQVLEVPIPNATVDVSHGFPFVLRPALGGDVYVVGKLQAESGIYRANADGTVGLLFKEPEKAVITDCSVLQDDTLLILLHRFEQGDTLLHRLADGTVETLFTSQVDPTQAEIEQLSDGSVIQTKLSEPNLASCDLLLGPEGEVWLFGQGKLLRWRKNDGMVTVQQRASFYRAEFDRPGTRPSATWGPDGALYFTVGDDGNEMPPQVRRFDPVTQTESIIAGKGGSVFTGQTVDERLSYAHSPVFNSAGELLFIDSDSRQIRRIPKDKLGGVPVAPSASVNP